MLEETETGNKGKGRRERKEERNKKEVDRRKERRTSTGNQKGDKEETKGMREG